MPELQANQIFYSSVVIEHIVPKGKGFVFRRWHNNLTNIAKSYQGFIRSDLCRPLPCADDVVKWFCIVHFDSPENLNQWIESDERKKIMESGRGIFRNYQFKSFTTGLEGWFSNQSGVEQSGLGPPAWKQVLSVVMGLYPTIMIQSMVFTALGIMKGWSLPSALIINNLVTSSLLTWVVMPFITRLIRFWLKPAHRLISLKTEILGTGVVTLALLMMVMIFNHLSNY